MKSTFLRLALAGALAIAMALSESAEAKKFTVLHSFAGGDDDGANPYGGVAQDGHGNFYVATNAGGITNAGTLILILKNGAATIVHNFIDESEDGENADGTPIVQGRYLFGTTQFGGYYGCGTVYRYTLSTGEYREAYEFDCAPDDPAFPFAGLSAGLRGDLVGTGSKGGLYDDGALFHIIYDGDEEDNYFSFSGGNGSNPYTGVAFVKDAYYMTATAGGSATLGTIAQFDLDTRQINVLHNFAGGSDGANPYGTLVYDGGSFLYGTTRNGGGPNLGTVFKMDVSGGNYTVLHTFQGVCCGNSDGSFPFSGLTLNPKDKMYYGTTINGGGPSDDGTIYKIDPNTGVETVVHTFTGQDGAHPYAAPYIDAKGRIYGTTLQGGTHDLGVVFKLKS